MKKKVLLLFDTGHYGYGDITNLMRIGRFLKSRGFDVYSTIIIPAYALATLPNYFEVFKKSNDIPSITHPDDIEDVKEEFIKLQKAGIEKLSGYVSKFYQLGLSAEIVRLCLEDYTKNQAFDKQMTSKKIKKILSLMEKTKPEHIDYEIALYSDCWRGDPSVGRKKITRIKRILIGQYADSDISILKSRSREFNYVISPIPLEEIEGIISAGYYTHHEYAKLPKEEIVSFLTKNKVSRFLKKHLLESGWGTYYSGTLGTNGLFFKLLKKSLPHILGKHKKITYFSFLDNHHFKKYVLPYLTNDIGVVDTTNKKETIITDPYKKDVILINLIAESDIYEAVVNCSELCSACAGDSSFNVLYNRLQENENFSFFKYFNMNQKHFFRFLVDKTHELEEKYKLNHDVSKCIFAFGYHEKIFQYYYNIMGRSADSREVMNLIDQMKIFENENELKKNKVFLASLFKEEHGYALLQKMFYDPKFIKKFNWIMRNLVTFIKDEDKLLPVEDILLELLR